MASFNSAVEGIKIDSIDYKDSDVDFTLLSIEIAYQARRNDMEKGIPYPIKEAKKFKCDGACGASILAHEIKSKGWIECLGGCLDLTCPRCAPTYYHDGKCAGCSGDDDICLQQTAKHYQYLHGIEATASIFSSLMPNNNQ